jgi:hypothetical protein
VLAAAITGASTVKYNHSALKLIVTDLPLMFAGTVPFFISQYPRAALAVLAGSTALVLAAIAILIYGSGSSVPLDVRVFFEHFICLRLNSLPATRQRHFVRSQPCPAAVLLLDLHGLAH